MVDLSKLTTEQRNDSSYELDQLNALEFVQLMNREDENVIKAIRKVLPEISDVINVCTKALKEGGRIIYIGAGTSGRLGVLDAVECPPTFGVNHNMVVGLLAGGSDAFVKAKEGAEDDVSLAKIELTEINLTKKDVVIGIAASGRTPYVIGGLKYAKSIGCPTATISNNKNSEMGEISDFTIEAVTGPEVLTGSTRLKAGSAQKMILNMISTGSMIGIGKAYQNLMVDVMQTNEKLYTRSENIIMSATNCERAEAKEALKETDGHVKSAIVMILLKITKEEAIARLNKAGGHTKKALEKNTD